MRRNIPPRTRPEIVAVLYPRLGSPGLFVVVVGVVGELVGELVPGCDEDIFFSVWRMYIEVSQKEQEQDEGENEVKEKAKMNVNAKGVNGIQ